MSAPAPPTKDKKKSLKPLLWALVCVVGMVFCGRIWQSGALATSQHNNMASMNPTIPLVKGSWTPIDTMGLRCEEVSISPPARRVVMVNNDPSRIFHLPAGIDNSIYLGRGVTSWQVMIEPDENVSSSKLEYKLVR